MSVNVYRVSKTFTVGGVEGAVNLAGKIFLDKGSLGYDGGAATTKDFVIAEFTPADFTATDSENPSNWPGFASGAIWQVSGADLIKLVTSATNPVITPQVEDNEGLNLKEEAYASISLTTPQRSALKSHLSDTSKAVALCIQDVYKCTNASTLTFANGVKQGKALTYAQSTQTNHVDATFVQGCYYAFLDQSLYSSNLSGTNVFLYCWTAVDATYATAQVVDAGSPSGL